MKVVKVWVAQDDSGQCFVYKNKPIEETKGNWIDRNNLVYGFIGENILCNSELKIQPIKCRIITENHYKVMEMD